MGGDPSWNDPRWGTDPIMRFDAGFDVETAGYVAVLDRSDGTLALTFRVSLGPTEVPDPADQLYVGIMSNLGDNTIMARAITLSPPALQPGVGPVAIENAAVAEYTGAWATPATASLSFVRSAAVWRGRESDMLSWSISLKLDLTAAGVDPTRSFRMAFRLHIEGRGDLLIPGDRAMLSDVPMQWAIVSLAGLPCTSRVSLYGRTQ
jgi:hypothetical protein